MLLLRSPLSHVVVLLVATQSSAFPAVVSRPGRAVVSDPVALPWIENMSDFDIEVSEGTKTQESIEVKQAVLDFAPRRPRKVRIALPPRDQVKEERTVRSLLQRRIAMNQGAKVEIEKDTALHNVETAAAVTRNHIVDAYQLVSRLQLEKQIQKQEEEQIKKQLEEQKAKAVRAEANQRMLLSARLQLNNHQRRVPVTLRERIREARRVKSPEEDAVLKAKYAAIENLGDRVYAILQDLLFFEEEEETLLILE